MGNGLQHDAYRRSLESSCTDLVLVPRFCFLAYLQGISASRIAEIRSISGRPDRVFEKMGAARTGGRELTGRDLLFAGMCSAGLFKN
jgi:hypothetical protein